MAEDRAIGTSAEASGEMHRLLFDLAHDAILLTAPDGRVLRANPAACQMFRMSEAEICAAGRAGLVDPADPRLPALLAEREHTGRVEGSLAFLREGRVPFEAEFWSTVFVDDSGEPRTWMMIRDVSERDRLEQELRRVSAVLAAQAEASPDGILSFDTHGGVTTYNARFLELWGLSPKTLTTGREAVVQAMLDSAGASDEARRVLAGDSTPGAGVIRGEIEIPGGRTIFCYSAPLWIGDSLLGRVLYHRDVTGLRKAEAEARTAAALLTAQFEVSPEGMVATGPDGRVIAYNRRLLEMVNLTEADMTSSPGRLRARLASLAADPGAVFALVERELAHPEDEHRAEIAFADGRVFDHNVRPLNLSQGRGVAWFYRDITEHKRLIEALRAGEQRLRSVLNAAVDGIIVIDRNGVMEAINPAAEEIFGYPEAEILDRNVSILMPEPYAREHTGYIERYLRTGQARVIGAGREVTGLRKDGTTFPLDLAVSEMGSGEGLRFVGIVRDITARKRSEEALVAAQKAESLGVLAGGIAHQLNNLLMSIMGNAGFVAMQVEPGSPSEEALKEIEDASARAGELTTALLSYSGVGTAAPGALNLSQLADEVATVLRARAPGGVSIVRDIAPGLPHVRLNPAQGRELLTHLLVNAFEAMAEQGGEVRVATGTVSATRELLAAGFVPGDLPEGDYVSLEVADSGPGIPPEALPRIFDPFFSTRFMGRGLGLSAVLGIVRGASGAIRASNRPDGGASFTILLPIASPE